MPPVNVRSAAKLTGKDRSTITRAIDKGRLSAARDGRGRYLIEPSELERVFGALVAIDARTDAEPVHATMTHEARALAREAELLREMLERERRTQERERRAWEDERDFLRALVERQGEQLRLLSFEPPATAPGGDRPGRWWLRRLFRRGPKTRS